MIILTSAERQCSVALENQESDGSNDREHNNRCNEGCSEFWLADSCGEVSIVSKKFVLRRSGFSAEDRSRPIRDATECHRRITSGRKGRGAIHIEVSV